MIATSATATVPVACVALWRDNPDIAFTLPLILGRAGLAVALVDSADALLHAADTGAIFLVIDCSQAPDASARCRAVITCTAVPVHICHPSEPFVVALAPVARGPLVWLPPEWTGLPLLHHQWVPQS